MSRRSESALDGLLWEWADMILKEISGGEGWSSTTTEYRIMFNLPRAQGVYIVPIPNYWPKPKVRELNNQILSLPAELRDAIVARYVLNKISRNLAECCNCSVSTAYDRINRARKLLTA